MLNYLDNEESIGPDSTSRTKGWRRKESRSRIE